MIVGQVIYSWLRWLLKPGVSVVGPDFLSIPLICYSQKHYSIRHVLTITIPNADIRKLNLLLYVSSNLDGGVDISVRLYNIHLPTLRLRSWFGLCTGCAHISASSVPWKPAAYTVKRQKLFNPVIRHLIGATCVRAYCASLSTRVAKSRPALAQTFPRDHSCCLWLVTLSFFVLLLLCAVHRLRRLELVNEMTMYRYARGVSEARKNQGCWACALLRSWSSYSLCKRVQCLKQSSSISSGPAKFIVLNLLAILTGVNNKVSRAWRFMKFHAAALPWSTQTFEHFRCIVVAQEANHS